MVMEAETNARIQMALSRRCILGVLEIGLAGLDVSIMTISHVYTCRLNGLWWLIDLR